MDIDTESLARRPSLKRLRRSPERFVAGNKDSPATEQVGNIRSKKSRKQKPFERLSQPSDELLGRRVAVSFTSTIGTISLAYFIMFRAYLASCESVHVFQAALSFLPLGAAAAAPLRPDQMQHIQEAGAIDAIIKKLWSFLREWQ